MNKAVDLLVNNKCNGQIEIKRLSEQFGQPFLLNIRSVDIIKIYLIEDKDKRLYELLEQGIEDDIASPELLKHYNVNSFKDIINILFTADEVMLIKDEIEKISTITEDEIKDIEENDICYDNAYWLWKNKYIKTPSEYYQMSYQNKILINSFIKNKKKEDEETLKHINKAVKDSKSTENAILNVLYRLLIENL